VAPAVAATRVQQRAAADAAGSDATPALAVALAADEAPWPEATTVDTSVSALDALAFACRALATAGLEVR
jgi:hypothetical protein